MRIVCTCTHIYIHFTQNAYIYCLCSFNNIACKICIYTYNNILIQPNVVNEIILTITNNDTVNTSIIIINHRHNMCSIGKQPFVPSVKSTCNHHVAAQSRKANWLIAVGRIEFNVNKVFSIISLWYYYHHYTLLYKELLTFAAYLHIV